MFDHEDTKPYPRVTALTTPQVPMWGVFYIADKDKTWTSPVICIVAVERSYPSRHSGEDYYLETELRPVVFTGAGVDETWWEHDDALGYSLRELSDEEIRSEFADGIAREKRMEISRRQSAGFPASPAVLGPSGPSAL